MDRLWCGVLEHDAKTGICPLGANFDLNLGVPGRLELVLVGLLDVAHECIFFLIRGFAQRHDVRLRDRVRGRTNFNVLASTWGEFFCARRRQGRKGEEDDGELAPKHWSGFRTGRK